MRSTTTLGLLLLSTVLTACQPSQPPPSSDATPVAASSPAAMTNAAPPAPAPSVAASEATAAQGSRLGGTVSSLGGTVSDLKGLIEDLGGEVRGQAIHVELPADTLFAFDKADVVISAEGNLSKLASLIGKTQGAVQLIGHTDGKGSAAYNLDLSQRRAQSVAAWLQSHGVPAERLQAQGRGASEPLAPNTRSDGSDDPEGRAKNRRVEAIIPTP